MGSCKESFPTKRIIPRTNKFFVVTCRVATGLPARQGVSTSNILKGLQMKAVCRRGDWEDCDVLKALLRWKCMATNMNILVSRCEYSLNRYSADLSLKYLTYSLGLVNQ